MKKLVFIVAILTIFFCGCGKEDYHAHETETFRSEKTATFKKLSSIRSELKSAIWSAGYDKNHQDDCRRRLNRAVSAVSDADKIDSNFGFACKNLSCEWGKCRIHTIQNLIVGAACVSCALIKTSSPIAAYNEPVTEKHRESIEKAIADIDSAIAVLETPERFIKK